MCHSVGDTDTDYRRRLLPPISYSVDRLMNRGGIEEMSNRRGTNAFGRKSIKRATGLESPKSDFATDCISVERGKVGLAITTNHDRNGQNAMMRRGICRFNIISNHMNLADYP